MFSAALCIKLSSSGAQKKRAAWKEFRSSSWKNCLINLFFRRSEECGKVCSVRIFHHHRAFFLSHETDVVALLCAEECEKLIKVSVERGIPREIAWSCWQIIWNHQIHSIMCSKLCGKRASNMHDESPWTLSKFISNATLCCEREGSERRLRQAASRGHQISGSPRRRLFHSAPLPLLLYADRKSSV